MSSEDKGIMLTGELRDYLVGHSIPMTDAHRAIIADTLAGALSVIGRADCGAGKARQAGGADQRE